MASRREMRPEDFDTPTGFQDDFDAKVVEAWFGPPSAEYQDKAATDAKDPVLHLKLDEGDLEKPIEQSWSAGSARQWQVERDGAEVVSGKNPDFKNFVSTSRAAELVNRIIALAGEGDRKKGVEIVQGRGYYMTEAEFYLGIDAHWEQVEMETVAGEKRNVLMPTVLHGFGEGGGSATPGTPEGPGYTEEEVAKLLELASGKTEVQLKQGIMRSGLKGAKVLLDAVFNGDLLETLEKEEKLTKGPDGAYI